ncbi:hypothetical protein F5882DRAFT_386544 [Hyaloscypha sp. PMI_1271]|nr:hypothetical protein F5882DRAFT_386544 [Hyaloscypha sp. PMI_1271]
MATMASSWTQWTTFPNLDKTNGHNTPGQPNRGNHNPKGRVGLEENPYVMMGLGTQNAMPLPKTGFAGVKPWGSLKPLDFVRFGDLQIDKDRLVHVNLEGGAVGLALVVEIREDTNNRHFFNLMWVYSRKDIPNGSSWPDTSSYMLSTHVEAHKSDVIIDNATAKEIDKFCGFCPTYIYSFATNRICKADRQYFWMKPFIQLALEDLEA